MILFYVLSFTLSAGTSNITVDFSERLRVISWDNPITLDRLKEGGSTFTRHRTSLGLDWKIAKNAELYFKITNEFRIYFKPKKDFDVHEIFIDNLYLKVNDFFKLPVTLTIGRQNLFMGEGFIILDGNTYDGSRSVYFDAIRLDLKLNDLGNLSLFGLSAQKTDALLPVLNDKGQLLNQNDLRGYGFYYQGKIDINSLDLYYLKKKTDIREDNSWTLRTDTFGTKLSINIRQGLDLTAEGAVQYGSFDDRKIRAFGGHFHLDLQSGRQTIKKVTLGGIYLTGNSPGSEDIRGWDPPFSKWPKWSESYIYTLINEGGIADWSNISSIYITFLTKLFRNGSLNTAFNFLGAPEKNLAFDFPGGPGKFRGFLMINRLNIIFSKTLTGHLLWEHFRPGDFYFRHADNYNWIRFELLYKTKSRRR